MKRTVSKLLVAVLAVVASAASLNCGEASLMGCVPECEAHQVCDTSRGVCVDPAGDADVADDGGVEDVLPDEEAEAVEDEATHDEGGPEDGRRDEGGPEDGRRDEGGTPEAGTYNYGEPCDGPEDCNVASNPECLTTVSTPFGDIVFPGGYCTGECSASEPCGDPGVCLSGGGMSGCLRACETNDDCRSSEGYTCQAFGGPRFCAPPFGP